MKLSFVNTRMPGINTFLIRDLRSLIRLGVRVDLYLFDTESLDRDFREEIEAAGGIVERIPFPFGGGAVGLLLKEFFLRPGAILSDLSQVVRWTLRSPAEGVRSLAVLPVALVVRDRVYERGVSHVHALWAGVPTTVAYWISRHSDVGFSLSAHAWDLLQRTRGLKAKIEASTKMVVCSEFALETARRIAGPEVAERVQLVYHGLDLGDWVFGERTLTRPDALEIIAVGRLMPKKGFDHLVEACSILRDRSVPFSCRILGPDGGLATELRKLVTARGLSSLVQLHGECAPTEVRSRISDADVLCCPSVQTGKSSDGIPNVVLEALALGTPVVSTDAGGLGEVILHGKTGLRVPQRDPDAIAAALVEVWTDWDCTVERAREGRRLIESKFDAEATALRFLEEIGLADPQRGGGIHAPALN